MEATVAVLGVVEALEDGLVLVELLLLDRHVDTDDVLPDNTSSANVQVTEGRRGLSIRLGRGGGYADICGGTRNRGVVKGSTYSPDFRVPHEPITKSYCETVRMKSAHAMVLGDGVHVGRSASVDRVAFHALLRRDAPAIVYTNE